MLQFLQLFRKQIDGLGIPKAVLFYQNCVQRLHIWIKLLNLHNTITGCNEA
jgi:hypothetical protein